METSNGNEAGKKLSFEDFSKEDLIKKCKSLLVLTQKAKQVKEALQKENEELKMNLQSEGGGATNEIIEKLTQQKLLHVTTIEDLKQQNNILNNKLQTYIQELQNYDEKINQLDSENVSLKRQTRRLTDENEQLLTHLDSLEKQIDECKRLGLEQQNNLLALEKCKQFLEDANAKLKNEQVNNQTPELQKMLSISLEEIKKVKSENAAFQEKLEDVKLNMVEKDKTILMVSDELQAKVKLVDELKIKLDTLQNNVRLVSSNKELKDEVEIDEATTKDCARQTIEKLKEKLKTYHSKMVKMASNIKILKEDKNEILSLFRTYTNQVETWILQLNNGYEKLLEYIGKFQEENNELLKENQVLKDNNAKFIEQLKAHKTDDEKSKDLIEIENIKTENIYLKDEMNRLLLLEQQYQSHIEINRNNILEIENLKSENIKLTEEIKRLLIFEKEYKIVSDEAELIKAENIELKNEKCLLNLEEHGNAIETKDKAFIELEVVKKEYNELKERMCHLSAVEEQYKSQTETVCQNLNELENIKVKNVELEKVVDRFKNLEEEHQSAVEAKAKVCTELEALKKEHENLAERMSEMLTLEENYKVQTDLINQNIIEIENMREDNKNLCDEVSRLSILEKEYERQIESLLIEKDIISSNLNDLEEKHQEELQVYNDQSKKDNIEYRKIISKLEEDTQQNLREIDMLKQNNVSLEEELEVSRKFERVMVDKKSEEILKLVLENAQLMEQNRFLQEVRDNMKEVDCQTDKDSEIDDDLKENITSLKRENAELLTEMNEMNQALKERGETISKFQSHYEEVVKKLQIYESQANKNVDSLTHKDEIIKSLQQQIEKLKQEKSNGNEVMEVSTCVTEKYVESNELKKEIESWKEKFNGNMDISYAESENMSTSTISRTEEVNRLKDLEGSWEERYGKLRSLAIKLKGKVRDLSAELLKEQNEKNDIQQRCSNSIKNVSTLQSQCDKLDDELDFSKKQVKEYLDRFESLAVETSKDKQKLADNDELIVKLKKELEELKQEKVNTEAWKKQISSKVKTLRTELEAHKVLKKEYEAKISKLTSELEVKAKELKTESDYHQLTKTSLEYSNNERKKNSVLNLEMQDYERSVKELSQKLEQKHEQISKLQSQLESQKSTVNAVREQNKLLEERVEEMKNEMKGCQSEVATSKKQISDLEEVVIQKETKVLNLTQLLETERSENEELSTELSKLIAEHHKTNGSLKNEKEHLKSQVLGLQQSLRDAQDNLKLKQDELSVIQSDYENYKVRAQSVLRQSQTRDIGLEEKLSEELSTIKVKYESALSELNESKLNLEGLKKENVTLCQEKVDFVNKYQEVTSEVEDLKILYDKLTHKYQQTVIENSETVRSLKVHADTLAQCYRQQLSEQELRHNREILELQSKIEKATPPSESPFSGLPTMPREEGEGSESTETTNKNMYPVPLERLLGADTDKEMAFLKKQLTEEESKVMHLTALLADTEQDLAKHAQMNKLLKEEIRRQQRSVEREKHAENLEYLKNVVFKFVTLHSGDERSRLVPVLNTILKLSPEETKKLAMVARGDPGIKGWTNYLPLWPSPSKS